MGRQLVTVGMGMGSVFLGEDSLFDGFMFRVRQRVGSRVVPGIFQLAIPVLAGSCFGRDFQIDLVFWGRLSWGHNE